MPPLRPSPAAHGWAARCRKESLAHADAVDTLIAHRGIVADVQNTQNRVQVLEQSKTTERTGERLAVVESQVTDIKAATLRVEANVQKLVERRAP